MVSDLWVPNLDVPVNEVQLLVGYRSIEGVSVGQVPLGADADLQKGIREVCSTALEEAKNRTAGPWTAESGWERDEARVVQLVQLDEASVVRAALEKREYAELTAKDLDGLSLHFYAFVLGTQPAVGEDDSRLLLLKKRDPKGGLSRRLIAVLDVALTRLTRPVFTFDASVDLIYAPGRGVLAMNANAFELLFQDAPDIVRRTPELARKVASLLPVDEEVAGALEKLAVKRSRVRRKLSMLATREHLESVTAEKIQLEMERHGIPVADFIKDGKIVVTSDDGLKTLVELLNEDLLTGGLSGQSFIVDRKSPRSA